MPRPTLVELVGAPGAGKSTVFAALQAADRAVVGRPILTRSRNAPWLSVQAALLLGTLVRRRALDRRWYPNMIAMSAELRALPRVLERRAPGEILVFDQGPLFTLTRPRMLDARLHAWSGATFELWMTLLDVVVWLDAPDAELIARIRARPKTHRIKDARDEDARDWIARDRERFGPVLDRVEAAPGGPAVLRFDTSQHAPEAVARDVLAAAGSR